MGEDPTKIARVCTGLVLLCLIAPSAARAQRVSFAVVPNSGSLSLIDTFTDVVGLSPSGPGNQNCVAVTPDGRRAYVTSISDGLIRVDLASGQSTQVRGGSPICVAVTPDNKKLYIATPSLSGLRRSIWPRKQPRVRISPSAPIPSSPSPSPQTDTTSTSRRAMCSL